MYSVTVRGHIGRATDLLNGVLGAFNYRNLDEEAAFAGRNTTTEVLARSVFDRLVVAIDAASLGPGSSGIDSIRVTLHESHIASASYEGRLG